MNRRLAFVLALVAATACSGSSIGTQTSNGSATPSTASASTSGSAPDSTPAATTRPAAPSTEPTAATAATVGTSAPTTAPSSNSAPATPAPITPAPVTPTTGPTTVVPQSQLAAPDDTGFTEIRYVDVTATPAVTTGPCTPAWTPPPAAGVAEVTFISQGALWSTTGADVRCLATIEQPIATAVWKPTADRLLLDGTTILDAAGQHPNGLVAHAGVSWSRPTGKALIAPSADAKQLVHVDSSDPTTISNVAALADTWLAAYYPSGTSIITAGRNADGTTGLFLADNVGNIRRPIATLDDVNTKITEIGVLSDGSGVVFIHDHRHPDGTESTVGPSEANAAPIESELHVLSLPDLKFQDVAALHHSMAGGLVTAMDGNHNAAFAADASTVGTLNGIWYRFQDRLVTPAGLDAAGNTYVVVRTEASQTGQLWKLPTTGPDVPASVLPELIAENVSLAMVRLQQGEFTELPEVIEARAPG